MAECKLALRQKSKAIDLCRLAVLRLCFGLRLFISFRGQLRRYGLLEFLSIYAVAFGGVHENVVAACGGSLIRRIQQADFQKQLAEFGLVKFADLLGQKFLRRRGVLLRLYLVSLRQSRNLAIREAANQVVGDRQQVSFLQWSRNALKDRSQDTMASRDRQFLLLDPLAFVSPLPLDLLRRRRVRGVGAARRIGTNLDDLSALAAVHDNRLRHLVTGFLNG